MYTKQSWVSVFHALQMASMPFSTVIGLVIFGMLTAPPSYQKPPETISELFSAAEGRALAGKQEESRGFYNRIIAQSPGTWALASAYWGRGATYFNQFSKMNSRVRSLRLKMRSDPSFTNDYQTTQQAAQSLFNQGIADHRKAAQIAEASGLVACGQEIREILPRLSMGMVRYNNPYSLYLKRKLPRC